MTPNTDIVLTFRITNEFNNIYPLNDEVKKCIETLKQHTRNFRPIFVDDNSDEQGSQLIQSLAAQFPYSLCIKTHHQKWFTRAVNLGLRMVRTPYVAVLNCDTVYDVGWLDELYAVKDEVESVMGKVGLVGSILSGEEPRRYAISNNPDYVTGHCWLLSMQALYEASASRGMPGIYLDETQPQYIHIRSDIEICWTMNKLGWQCVKAFKSNCGHIGGRTWGQQLWRIPGSLDAVNDKY